jgi:predicted GIY-YIG superfamily endonuclease
MAEHDMHGFHGCQYSFEELSAVVLPRLLSELMSVATTSASLKDHLQNQLLVLPKSRACYVFFEHEKPLYVGISRNLRSRVKQHLSNNRTQANLCVRFAAKSLDVKVSEAIKMDDFQQHFENARERLLGCSIAWVEVEDAMTLYLLEPFVAMKLDTQAFNRFDSLQILSPRSLL